MWQKCPVCFGTGSTDCDVCKGKKIIHEVTGLPPPCPKTDESFHEWVEKVRRKFNMEKINSFNAPFNLREIEEAFLTDPAPKKPPTIKCSTKAWKKLIQIKEVDKSFLPNSEYAIWLRARQIGIDPK